MTRRLIVVVMIFVCTWLCADSSQALRRRGYPTIKVGTATMIQPGDVINIIEREGYTLGYAPKFKQCVWVAYRLHPKDFESKVGRVGTFARDLNCPQAFLPTDYIGSGFDRGHMAPSGDMQFSLKAQKESFLMGNIVPQRPRINRGEWKRLETEVREMVMPKDEPYLQRHRPIYVITGPIFSSSTQQEEHKTEKPQKRLSPIPIAFYKVCRFNGKSKAFLIENNPNARLKVVDLLEVEAKTGLSFTR